MSVSERLLSAYFNYVYTPVYDRTTARFSRYRELQEKCLARLDFRPHDKILCIGLGTGNELVRIGAAGGPAGGFEITGIDTAPAALERARKKADRLGVAADLRIMDARSLAFAPESFDKVVCIHVLDFIDDDRGVTGEIFRVLKNNGQFVITYPSAQESSRLGGSLMSHSWRTCRRAGLSPLRAVLKLLPQTLLGLVYIPLLMRPNKKAYSREELSALFAAFPAAGIETEEDPVYQDFIISGKKRENEKGGLPSHAV
jgi:ubiquinone/menaquinone biosynthesis C-methylase UbiE